MSCSTTSAHCSPSSKLMLFFAFRKKRDNCNMFAVDEDLSANITDEVKVFADHVIRSKKRPNYLTALVLICVICSVR